MQSGVDGFVDGRIGEAIDACRRGLMTPPVRLDATGDDDYLAAVLHRSHLSEREREVILSARQVWTRGLRAARDGRLNEARRLFGQAARLRRDASLSAECQLLGKSFQAAGEAYLEYSVGKYDEAELRLHEALVADADLEGRGGYELLHLHRIQLVHNLVRVAIRRGCEQGALDLAWRLVNYLEGTQEVLPGSVSWNSKAIRLLPSTFVRAMFDQIVAEMALLVANSPGEEGRHFATAVAQHQTNAEGNRCCRFATAHAWLDLKRLFTEDKPAFVGRCCEFLQNEYAAHRVLWFATAVDLVAVCKSWNACAAQQLALDLTLFQPIPPVLAYALEKIL